MKLTIIPDDKKVYQNGISYEINAFDNVPSDIHALQWNSDLSLGWIEFKDSKQNQDINSLPDWALQLIVEWDNANHKEQNPVVVPLTTEQLLEKCKYQAKFLLSISDWSVLPDVGLANQDAFVFYRLNLRNLVKNPVTDPIWETEPIPVWE
jgi:hypothetical protein